MNIDTYLALVIAGTTVGGMALSFPILLAKKALEDRKQIAWRKAEFRRMARLAFSSNPCPNAMRWAKTYARELRDLGA